MGSREPQRVVPSRRSSTALRTKEPVIKVAPARRPRSRGLPKDWSKIRAAILRRDGHQCLLQWDGCTGLATEVDHIQPRRYGGGDTADNLRSVCSSCHRSRAAGEVSTPSRDW